MSADPFCPRHGRRSRPIEIPGLPCDCRSTRAAIYALIDEERAYQQRKFGDKSMAGELPLDTKFRILGEEVGEVAEALDELEAAQGSRVYLAVEHVRDELVDVAACAVAWLEVLR